MPMALRPATARYVLFGAFALSGFAGLIYESIWSHYLKLLLGHAAYAQTLVLVLFMGGMAVGSWMCGRLSAQITRPLALYALIELLLGVFALGFDPVFRAVADWVLMTAAPALGQPLPIEGLKWGVSALLILPACVLLGATFPLISAGVVRLQPTSSGNALGWLYFSNSLGAVAGVLTSGFVLIGWVGLPGTLLVAATCNFVLALLVWAVSRLAIPADSPADQPHLAASGTATNANIRALLATAFLTGTASFFYEVGWIRMLSLVLGSATHSFELMLGAFILGLALGALYIRNRIDHVADPLRTLGWVQVAMGTAALSTLVVYGWSFGWMGDVVQTLAKTDTGFAWFNVLSQGICMALMLPVTFFAGMTLPLITALVLRTSAGESAIGRVYAANTWGAILGVIAAVHLVMPLLGLRSVVVVGASVDLGLGLWLLARGGPLRLPAKGLLAVLVAIAVAIAALGRFDTAQLASGVYRHGHAQQTGQIVFAQDGRTASVVVTQKPGVLSILTNGKPDAALKESGTSDDDYTMVMLGLLPMALHPQAKTAALIGMGSGRTTHVILGAPQLESVDTIEIEPAMSEGARLFGPLTSRTFTDPRSHLYTEDAKTFFARHQRRYDVIVSEPSNPWVSGVASLFSREFYRQTKHHLAPGGLFVQWLQMYEFDDQLAGTVLAAVALEFADYAVYVADDMNVVIVATPTGQLPKPDAGILQAPGMRDVAASIGVRSLADLQVRRLVPRDAATGFVLASGVPANSDYFPFLDQRAARSRFRQLRAHAILGAHPVTHRLWPDPIEYAQVTPVSAIPATQSAAQGHALADLLRFRHLPDATTPTSVTAELLELAVGLEVLQSRCDLFDVDAVWLRSLARLTDGCGAYLNPQDAQAITAILRKNACVGAAQTLVSEWLALLDAVALHKSQEILGLGHALANRTRKMGHPPPTFVVREVLLAAYLTGGPPAVAQARVALGRPLPDDEAVAFLLALSAR